MRPLLARGHLGIGRLYVRAGDRDRAEEHLLTATRLFSAMDMPLWLPQAASSSLGELGITDGVSTRAIGATDTRIRSLDVLRGVGVLGMLATHIQLFAFPSLARWNPTAYGDFQGVNWWVWLATSVFADGKFIAIFAMLLGASIVMLPARAADGAIPAWRVHVRRMAALLVLGLLHAYLLWYGDMLVALALCGTVVFFARRLSPRWLLVLGGLAFAIGSVADPCAHVVSGPRPPGRAGGVEGPLHAAAREHRRPRSTSTRGDGPSRCGIVCRRPGRSRPGTSSPTSSGR